MSEIETPTPHDSDTSHELMARPTTTTSLSTTIRSWKTRATKLSSYIGQVT